MTTNPNVDVALRYFKAIEAGATSADLAAFFDPEVTQRELPNRLVPAGATRDLAALLAASARGKVAVRDQRYAVRRVLADGDEVAAEVDWTATLNVPLGKAPAGAALRAEFGVFLTFRNGRIVSQRNYDCFH